MGCKVFHTAKFKKLMVSIVTLSILAMVLPCNCMAEETSKPKDKHPCHSSQNESHDNKHKDCCCTDGIYAEASELKVKPVALKQTDSFKQNKVLINAFSSLFSEWHKSIALIRGSPPTSNFFSLSSKTFLARIQRWLI